jgi:hypothetical protein
VPEDVPLADGGTVFEAEGTKVCDPDCDGVVVPVFEVEGVLEPVIDADPVLVRVPLKAPDDVPDGLIVAAAVAVVETVFVPV